MNDEPLSPIDTVDLTAAQAVAVNGALAVKPKRKRRKVAKPATRRPRKTPDPLLAEHQASKASATPTIASLTEGAQPFEESPAADPSHAAGLPTFDREARYMATMFTSSTTPRPDLAPPAPSKWWQRFVAPFAALWPVERGVVSDDGSTLTIEPAPVVLDLSKGDVRWLAGIVSAALIAVVMLAIW